MTQQRPQGSLIGAYGLFWDRFVVPFSEFGAPSLPLFGTIGGNSTTRRVVDFSKAIGSYVLYDDYGPVYTGIRDAGLGKRLKSHDTTPPKSLQWTRFSWFAFGEVKAQRSMSGWSAVSRRARPEQTNAEANVREIEAILIALLGLKQNQMRFQRALRWEQLAKWDAEDFFNNQRVDPGPFPERWKREWHQSATRK